jgi:DNA-binding transcriptional LysR family regulator
MRLTLNQLKTIVSVAETLSMTQTGRHKRVTQTAVSHSIRNLEAEFGQSLVLRDGRGVELTETGANFSRDAQRILSAIEELYRKYSAKTPRRIAEMLTLSGVHSGSSGSTPSPRKQSRKDRRQINVDDLPRSKPRSRDRNSEDLAQGRKG